MNAGTQEEMSEWDRGNGWMRQNANDVDEKDGVIEYTSRIEGT